MPDEKLVPLALRQLGVDIDLRRVEHQPTPIDIRTRVEMSLELLDELDLYLMAHWLPLVS